MDDERKETKILVLCVLGAICVVIIAIIILIGIWTNEEDDAKTQAKKNDISSVGKYQTISFSLDEQVAKYSDLVVTYLTTENIDKIYEITNPEYLDYFGLDKEGLKKVLEQKGFYGTSLSCGSYNSSTYDSNNYIRLNISSEGNDYVDGTANIIEYSPNNYRVAFDRFVFYKKEPINYVREDLNIVIKDQVAYDTRYKASVSITNNTDNAVYINSGEDYEFIYLNTSNGEIGLAVHLYPGDKVEIGKGKTINLSLDFNIDDMSVNNIKSIVIKGVNISKTGVETDIELPL